MILVEALHDFSQNLQNSLLSFEHPIPPRQSCQAGQDMTTLISPSLPYFAHGKFTPCLKNLQDPRLIPKQQDSFSFPALKHLINPTLLLPSREGISQRCSLGFSGMSQAPICSLHSGGKIFHNSPSDSLETSLRMLNVRRYHSLPQPYFLYCGYVMQYNSPTNRFLKQFFFFSPVFL